MLSVLTVRYVLTVILLILCVINSYTLTKARKIADKAIATSQQWETVAEGFRVQNERLLSELKQCVERRTASR